ncbi:MAG TPA: ion channel [Saprospiraceae bacterium]|nr:ion channel [Saprospiraceae bacterium]
MSNRNQNSHSDLGYSSKDKNSRSSIILPDGSFNVKRNGIQTFNVYQYLMSTSWAKLLLIVFLFYLIINILFGFLYLWLGPEQIYGVQGENHFELFLQCFFFSVQSFTTVGYGGMHPLGHWASALASLEAFCGLLTFAIITGLVFSKFSKPSVFILFSKNLLITPFKGKASLQVRTVNSGKGRLIDLEATMIVTFDNHEKGSPRLFRTVSLEINKIVLFPLNWTLVHKIDEQSPLHHFNFEDYKKRNVEILIFLRGYDETYNQMVHTMRSYVFHQFVFNHKFSPMFEVDEKGTILHLDKLNELELTEEKLEL